MAKEHYERTKPHVNIGTIGHVDPDVIRNMEIKFFIGLPPLVFDFVTDGFSDKCQYGSFLF